MIISSSATFRILLAGTLMCSGTLAEESPPPDAATDDTNINEWRSFRNDELRQLERRRADAKTYSKFSESTLSGLAPAIAAARASTVELLDAGERRLCYGIVVDPGGYVLTKASEIVEVGDALHCRFPGGITVAAEIADMFPPYDLALIKAHATGLTAANWELAANEDPGTIVIAAGTSELPLSFGVLSVRSRMLNPGFLGVALSREHNLAMVNGVVPESGAMAAGIQPGDIILEVEGKPIADSKHLIATVTTFSVGEEIKLKLNRQGAELEVMVLLGSRQAETADPNRAMLEKMEVKLSRHRIDFPSALEHDLPLNPDQCGGPLVNLDGQLIGMNIARAGRIRSLAVPAVDLAPLLNATAEGRFSIPDPEALKLQLAGARQAVAHARATLETAETKAANLERALQNLKKYRLPQPEKEELESDQTDAESTAPDGDGGEVNPEPIP